MSASYGSWPSPITAELLTGQTVALGDAVVHQDRLVWAEARPERGGKVSLMRTDPADASAPAELVGEPYSVRSRVQEYGGGAWAVAGDVCVFSDFTDNRLHRLDLADGSITALTPERPAHRFGALSIGPAGDIVIAVREDHSEAGAEAVTTVVALDLTGENEQGGRVLCSGADFYADPALSADGRLAWIEWDHPNMPWDDTRLLVADVSPADESTGQLDTVSVAGGVHESVAHPTWLPDGGLVFVSDRTDWWNLYRWDGEGRQVTPVCPTEAEFCLPPWTQGQRPFVVRSSDELVCTINSGNLSRLARLQLSTGSLTPIETDAVAFGPLSTDGRRLATTLGFRDRPRTLSVLDLDDHAWTDVASSSSLSLPTDLISSAEEVGWTSAAGEVHGWFYPPTNPAVTPDDDERPPMITVSHGGPTSGSAPVFNLDVQYWTSRGFAILDVNYSGSTGYGRPYRERLRDNWGVLDVGDCIDGTLAMAQAGRADRDRLAIRGGSAGGYTTLRALTSSEIFGAGISLYGIGDLESLASDSHKFESRYLDSLVGPYPETAEIYRDRSPIHHLDRLRAPILLLQGSDDAVVPPNQAEMFADAARAQGLPVAMIIFAGEGHGFRQPTNVRAALEASLYFLGRVFGFTPADELEPIEIANLDEGRDTGA